jgi:hypothetical protein
MDKKLMWGLIIAGVAIAGYFAWKSGWFGGNDEKFGAAGVKVAPKDKPFDMEKLDPKKPSVTA